MFSAELLLDADDAAALRATADGILKVRNEKFPVTMKCAGSIFKNLLLKELPPDVAAAIPPAVVREGKIPAAWFLEQVGAKGLERGAIHVATYHANLIYNSGGGTAVGGDVEDGALHANARRTFDVRSGITRIEAHRYVGMP